MYVLDHHGSAILPVNQRPRTRYPNRQNDQRGNVVGRGESLTGLPRPVAGWAPPNGVVFSFFNAR